MDYYAILEIPKTASQEEIKKAYRKLAMKHHPDRNGGNETQFKKLQEAYDTLSDPNKKQQYDNPQPQQPNFGFNINDPYFNDIVSQMFGGRRNNNKQTYRTSVTISLIDAYKGSTHSMQLSTPTGVKLANINVPPGISTGDSVRYDEIIENAILIVQFIIIPDLRFDRKDNDLYSTQNISILDLIVGTKFKFTTIDQRVLEVKIIPKSQPHIQLRIPKAGMPDKNGGFGDQIILLKPFMPDNISQEIISAIDNHLNRID